MIYVELFWNFLMIGALSFGGGYGMISLVRETVLGRGWLTEGEFLSFIAVSESTPGRTGRPRNQRTYFPTNARTTAVYSSLLSR